jgi:hypothetical protein
MHPKVTIDWGKGAEASEFTFDANSTAEQAAKDLLKLVMQPE